MFYHVNARVHVNGRVHENGRALREYYFELIGDGKDVTSTDRGKGIAPRYWMLVLTTQL
jgi:hypothetical protein